MHLRIYSFFTILIGCLILSSFIHFKKLPKPNEKVLEYVKSVMHQKVGTGECSDLIFNAQYYLKQNKISSNSLKKVKKILPGDFISFYNVKVPSEEGTLDLDEHHAIIFKVHEPQIYTIVHQNHNNNKTVQTLRIDLNDIKDGHISIKHP